VSKLKAFALYESLKLYFTHTYSQVVTYTQMLDRTAWDSFPVGWRCMGRLEPSLIGSHGQDRAHWVIRVSLSSWRSAVSLISRKH